jgi:microcystin-dependent protein
MNGQLLPIAGNEVLFTLIGTTWGGDGQTTFALPDMRGRAIMGSGTGPSHPLGEVGGTESETLGTAQLPPHSHGFNPQASLSDASATSPAGKVFANKARTTLYAPGPGNVAMQATVSGTSGGAQPLNNMQPYLPVKCVVAAFGIFPAQN